MCYVRGGPSRERGNMMVGRGGLTTKFHLACDGKGRPLAVVITPGQRHDSTQLAPVLDGIRVPRPGGRGDRAPGLTAAAPDPAHHSRATRPTNASRSSARTTTRL